MSNQKYTPHYVANLSSQQFGCETPFSEYVPAYLPSIQPQFEDEDVSEACIERQYLQTPLLALKRLFGEDFSWSFTALGTLILENKLDETSTTIHPEIIFATTAEGKILRKQVYRWASAWMIRK